MNFRPSHSHQPASTTHFFKLQPVTAWVAILGFAGFTALCTLVGLGNVLRVAFPAIATLVGLLLYQKYPLIYVGFTYWVWFLTPFVRRLSDYQAGWQDPSPILLTPYLVTFISILTLVNKLPRVVGEGSLPFVLSLAGVIYGLLIGLANTSPKALVAPFLEWFAPVLFGFYLYSQWRAYPTYCQLIRRIFLWGILVTGAYGIYQYVVAPQWDRFWLISSELFTSGGDPEPYGMRVFSTMHSAGPYSFVTLAGLLLLFSTESPLRYPTTAVGYLSFLLTQVRSAWLGWGVGFLTLFVSLKSSFQIRMLFTVVTMIVCVLPLVAIEPFEEVITSRLESFTNLDNDVSFNSRSQNYDANLDRALFTIIGKGLGGAGVHVDSAIFETLFSLGWIGTLLYVGGLLLLLYQLMQTSAAGRSDPFISASRGICLSIFLMMVFDSHMLGLSGTVFWGFLAMGMAGKRYYKAARMVHSTQ